VSSAALASTTSGRPAINPWFVAAAVVVPTFMEVLDTTIANVALRYIAGGLSASNVDSEWVLTSYLAANATILPITGWLSARVGRRNYFLLSIAIFTIASGLCGMATSLEQLILFRVIQGLGGGGLQPSSQAILLDSFPPEKQGAAQTMFGIAALLAPVVGPTLGGYLTVQYNWRWIFYINVPVGALGFFVSYLLVDDPDYLKKERAELRRQPLNLDYIGLGLLVLIMSSWEIMLSKGQEWDWYNDPFWRVQTLFILFVVGLLTLIVYEMRIANPVVNFRPLGERNFSACCIIIFCAYGVLYAASTSLPGLLQSQFGYDAYVSGLVQSPSGVFSILGLIVVGRLIGRGIDARWLIAAGLLIMAAGNYWMALMNLYISPDEVIWPRVVLIVGLSMLFVAINVAAFKYIPPHLRGAAVGLFALLRNEGGSVGTSMSQALQWRRDNFHTARVGEFLDLLNPTVTAFLEQSKAFFLQQTGDAAASAQMALQSLENLRLQQASSLAYFDNFWLFAVLALGLVCLVPLMKRSVAEKGEHIGAE
jgi:MFS transporter, DHA2 family, multidrug resistance protein